MPEDSTKSQIASVQVRGLYNRFDHDITFGETDNIIIIHAPNGYGKTVTLKLIDLFFKKRFSAVSRINFSEVIIKFRNNANLIVRPSNESNENLQDNNHEANLKNLKIFFRKENQEKEHTIKHDRSVRRNISRSMVDRYVPHLDRLASDVWGDSASGNVLSFDEVMDLYSDRFSNPESGKKLPAWLEEALSWANTRLIETQRLFQIESERRYPKTSRNSDNSTSVVYRQAKDLATRIDRTFALYSVKSQKLDQSFPQRVLIKVANKEAPRDEEALRKEINDLERKREYLTEAGLLTQVETALPLSSMQLSEDLRRVLEVYIEDTRDKLTTFDDMFARIDLFKRIINGKFRFKYIDVTADQGVVVFGDSNVPLDLSALSSGEQHELVLIYDLIFESNANSFLLIDEPEISLHVAWQKRFLPDLIEIMKINRGREGNISYSGVDNQDLYEDLSEVAAMHLESSSAA